MTLPNSSVFNFYEGTDPQHYTDLTGINLNAAAKALLANDVAIKGAVNDLETKLETKLETNLDNKSTCFKNHIINGGFDVWQRGTSFASGVNYYSADRWRLFGYEAIISKDVDALKVKYNDADGGTDNFVGINQTIETINSLPLVNKEVTLSVTLKKGNNFEGNLSIGLGARADGNDLIALSTFAELNVTSLIGTDFTTVTLTATIPSNARSIGVNINQTATTTIDVDNYYVVSNVQLEEGPVATSFEQRPYGLELSLCQRYYEKFDTSMVVGQTNSTNGVRGAVMYSDKRTIPTMGAFNLGHFNDNRYSITINSISFSNIRTDSCRFDCALVNSDLLDNNIVYGMFGAAIDAEL